MKIINVCTFFFLFFFFASVHCKTKHVLDTNKVWRTMKKRFLALTKSKRNNVPSNKRMAWMGYKRCWRWSRRPAMFGIKCRQNSNKSNQQSSINRMIGQQMMSMATTKAVSLAHLLQFTSRLVSSGFRLARSRKQQTILPTKAIDKNQSALIAFSPFQAEIYCRIIKIQWFRFFFSVINFFLLSFDWLCVRVFSSLFVIWLGCVFYFRC